MELQTKWGTLKFTAREDITEARNALEKYARGCDIAERKANIISARNATGTFAAYCDDISVSAVDDIITDDEITKDNVVDATAKSNNSKIIEGEIIFWEHLDQREYTPKWEFCSLRYYSIDGVKYRACEDDFPYGIHTHEFAYDEYGEYKNRGYCEFLTAKACATVYIIDSAGELEKRRI